MKKIIMYGFGVLALVTSACGHRKADPIDSKYKDMVVKSVPSDKNQKPPIEQTYVVPGLITVNSPGEFDFRLGEATEYKINVAVDDGKTSIELAKKDELPWLNLTRSTTELNTWILSGTPPVDALPKCQMDSTQNVDFEIIILSAPDKATADLLAGSVKTFQRNIKMNASHKEPVILCVSENCEQTNPSKLIVENGKIKSFDVVVFDETATSVNPPQLKTFDNSESLSQETKEVPGSAFVLSTGAQPKELGDHKWLFKRVFNTQDRIVPILKLKKSSKSSQTSPVDLPPVAPTDPAAPVPPPPPPPVVTPTFETLQMAFSMQVKSGSCLYSPEKLVDVELQYIPEVTTEVKK